MILVNLKTYAEGTGGGAVRIAELCAEASEETGERIAVAPQAADLYRVSRETDAEVWAQHVDAVEPGSNTGHALPEAVRGAGAVGTLINHSERRLTLADAGGAVEWAREVGLETIVCSNDASTSAAASELEPDYVAIEPPELIGTGIPVSRAEPEIVEGAVAVSDVPVLCGAGISTGEDVEAALSLGAEGVLLASGVVKADEPGEALRDLVSF